MASSSLLNRPEGDASLGASALDLNLAKLVERAFGQDFNLLDGATGEVLLPASAAPRRDWSLHAELCRQVAQRGQPEFIDEEDPLITLAIPLCEGDAPRVAAATFLTRRLRPHESLARPCAALGLDLGETTAWATRQSPWPPEALRRIAELVAMEFQSQQRIRDLEHEARSLSVNLASTYEEISLLYRLTQNLRISESDEDLGRIAIEWLAEVIPAEAMMLQLLPLKAHDSSLQHTARPRAVLLSHGAGPLDEQQFTALMAHLNPTPGGRPVVMNRAATGRAGWPLPAVRQTVVVSLMEGEHLFGWLAAVNHVDDAEFGTVEASLLNSVSAILGIHSGNIELYRQQSELLAGIVRALTSAIDAKDQYTCGHSDRVARIAVRLAEEMHCDPKTLSTIYLAGLLHDIGKIGIDDQVLRKPDKLTDAEYEHIKGHPVIGHKILRDLGKLEDVLPVVLHHHESWDGAGYPNRLVQNAIPLAARIVAVADSFDAMGSDRPYRKGMPDEKIDRILRGGAGQQWDPEVIDAFFRARGDLREICNSDREQIAVDFQQWR